jgi:hypothetical protein
MLQTSISPAQETLVTIEPKDIYPFAINNPQLIQGQFARGTNLTVIGREGGWLKVNGYVRIKEYVGWIKGGGLTSKGEWERLTTGQLVSSEILVGYALTENFPVYLRASDDDYASPIHTIPGPSVVGVIEKRAKWYRVEVLTKEKRLQGWIRSSDARLSENGGPEKGLKQTYENYQKELEAAEEIKQRIIAEKETEKGQRLTELETQAKQIPELNCEAKIAAYSKLSEIDPVNTSYQEMIQLYTDKMFQQRREKAARDQERSRKAEEEKREKRLKAEEQKRQEALQTWLARIDALPHPEEIKSLVRERKICIGMSADAVVLSWGQPDDKNTTVYSWGKQEQCYRKSDYKNDYLHFDNGILKSYQLQGR